MASKKTIAAGIGTLMAALASLAAPAYADSAASAEQTSLQIPVGSVGSFPGMTSTDSDTRTKARPTGCDYGTVGDYGSLAWCDHDNGGSWRAIAVCKSPSTGKILYGYGNWTNAYVSQAFCNGDSKVQSAGIETSTKDNT
ncbi:hypothetical protein [Streptomyces sp. UG1]|uniref:hypothetical protein n=1 Tax=Streptomyces sp. UG1 TaxID=3417652 RepID=UPI003CF89ECF